MSGRDQYNQKRSDYDHWRGSRGGRRGDFTHYSGQTYQSSPSPTPTDRRQAGYHRPRSQHFQAAPLPKLQLGDRDQIFSLIGNHLLSSGYGSRSGEENNGNSDPRRRHGYASPVSVRENDRRDADRRRDRHRMDWQDEERRDQGREERRKELMRKTPACGIAAASTSGRENGNGSRDEPSSSSNVVEHSTEPQIRERRSPAITTIVPTKPSDAPFKQGTSGERVLLTTNYFKILKKPTWPLFMYRVDFSPETEIRSLKAGMLFEQFKSFGPHLFDGTVLYLMSKFDKEVTEFMAKVNRDQQPFRITVKLVGQVSPNTHQYLHVWSILLRKCVMALGLKLVGRNYYDPKGGEIVSFKKGILELWPGFATSIRQHERDLLLCADVSTKVMRTETAFDILRRCHEKDRNTFKTAFCNELVGATVLTTYAKGKTYKITEVDFDQTPRSTFRLQNGATMSYIDYYRERHNVNIRDVDQPMLISLASQRELRAGQASTFALVPELCFGFTDEMSKNYSFMKTVADRTRLDPNQRMAKLTSFNLLLQDKCRDHFEEFDFRLDTNFTQVEGRRFKNEEIIFGKNQRVTPNDKPEWARSFHKNEMYVSQPLNNWVLIHQRNNSNYVHNFLRALTDVGSGMNYPISYPRIIEVNDNDWRSALSKGYRHDPQLFVCVVPFQRVDVYSTIKKLCCVEYGIPSQVLVANMKNANKSVATKVAIQINCKLGGVPWLVELQLKGLMTIGFDVCHDTVKKDFSYGAMVATMDMRQKQQYFSTVSTHVKGTELSNHFAINIRLAIRAYRDNHQTLPERILIYRDGVGEGQTHYVKEIEIKSIVVITVLHDLYPIHYLIAVCDATLFLYKYDMHSNNKIRIVSTSKEETSRLYM